jgi:lipoate-protein ligase A
MAATCQHAFARLGVLSHVGELPGEYCPGEYSINAGGRKVMGVGQRLARNAAHVGGVIVVSDGSLVRRVLVPVYRALGLGWKPETAGSLQDVAPATTLAAVADAVVGVLGDSHRLYPTELDVATLDLAAALTDQHRSPASGY